MIKVLYRCWEERINKCFGFFKDFVNLSSMEKQGPQKGHCAPRFAPLFWKNIRKKLDADYIETIRGVGYRIDKEH